MAKTGTVTLGEWIVTMLLMVIPIVNLVLLVIWGFGGNANESKANWAKATLIFIVISFVLSLVMGSALAGIFASMGRG
ncbi:hypothetical protein JXR74_05550 [Candidatus Mcinerneyibacteriota bacterium]|nr:hypothetical protein [Candidatus Mcinerneyibacteriota bacterium]